MRTHYNNGDDISLQANGCDGCNPSTINGVFCHEIGCPDAWRDYTWDCKECGIAFKPEYKDQEFCGQGCAANYHGM